MSTWLCGKVSPKTRKYFQRYSAAQNVTINNDVWLATHWRVEKNQSSVCNVTPRIKSLNEETSTIWSCMDCKIIILWELHQKYPRLKHSIIHSMPTWLESTSRHVLSYNLSQEYLTGFSTPKNVKISLKIPINFRSSVFHSKFFLSVYQGENIAWTAQRRDWKTSGILAFQVLQKENFVTWYNSTSCLTQMKRKYHRTHDGGPDSWSSILRCTQNT